MSLVKNTDKYTSTVCTGLLEKSERQELNQEYKYCNAEFKKKYSLTERKKQSKAVSIKYPNKIPIIIEKIKGISNPIPDLKCQKYLIPNDIYLNQLIYIIYRKLELNSNESIYLFANDTLLNTSESIISIAQRYKDADGFLYIYYTAENVFG